MAILSEQSTSSLKIRNNLELSDSVDMNDLQLRIDQAEKEHQSKYVYFNDKDMVNWFLHENKHLRKSDGRTKRSTKEYQRELQQFIEALLAHGSEFNLDIEEIVEGSIFKSLQPRHIRKYQEWLQTSSPYVRRNGSYATATLERKTTILRSFFRFLHEADYITEQLEQGLKIIYTKKDDRPNRDLGPEDVVKLLRKFQDMQHHVMFAIVHILTTTGMRNEEFCTLKVKDLKRDTINGGWYLAVTGKGNKRRDIPVKSKVLDSILLLRNARGLTSLDVANGDSPLFTTNTGNAYTPPYLSQYVKKEIQKIKAQTLGDTEVTITPHVFRHAFAIISQQNGIDVYQIMRSLGHEKIDTTMIYLQKVFERNKHAIHKWKSEKFGEFI
ncbi:tyrosine-type recombinase/integrase [Rummeliibacillus stabekisii]|uniref:tyrosine-type recombinase/integrase n=1 Tax=Rummeliibacillus stabekisii TaxID=241244 RepID=UPI0011700AF6|nr:tyrosine-type recombinase/integrase [Rummeliibacillus stabekisii]MBB5171634.1 site-specific recombinase XerD [Rummeliibacillus stabekisii]GEL05481.1 tyrosine recombinase XerC [Rummeliibacillus stabekisii]